MARVLWMNGWIGYVRIIKKNIFLLFSNGLYNIEDYYFYDEMKMLVQFRKKLI